MKNIKSLVLLIFITLAISCSENKEKINGENKNTTRKFDLDDFKSQEYNLDLLFSHGLSDSIGFIDTVFSKNGIVILKTNLEKIEKTEYDPIITIRKITIINRNVKVYERRNLINFGEIEYNQKLNLITIPLILEVENESFSTTCSLLLFDIKANKILEIEKDLTDLTNAPISNDSTVYYIANNSIYSFRNLNINEIVNFDNPTFRFFGLLLREDKGFKVIYSKDFPEDPITFETVIPVDSILKI